MEWINKKKADPVGIGLLKEGDDACVLSEKQPAGFTGWLVPGFKVLWTAYYVLPYI